MNKMAAVDFSMTSETLTTSNVTFNNVVTVETSNVTFPNFSSGYVDDYEYDYYESLESLPIGEVVPVSLVYGFTLLFGLGGNSLVILVVVRNERLRSITNIFLTSLASADLVLVSFCVPVKCAAFFSFTWAFGEFLCKAVHYIQAVSMVCSVMTLTVMSIERNIAILFPLRAKYLCTRGHAHIVIGAIWVMSFAMASPILIGQKHIEVGVVRKAYWCIREWAPPGAGLAFDIYMLLLLFLLPVIIMAAAYTGIARALWRSSAIRRSVVTVSASSRSPASESCIRSWRSRPAEPSATSHSEVPNSKAAYSLGQPGNNTQQSGYSRLDTQVPDRESLTNGSARTAPRGRTVGPGGGGVGPGGGGVGPESKVDSQRTRLEREKVKVVKMLVVVVLLFAVCWGPVLINNVLVTAGVLSQLHHGYLKPLRQAFYLLSYFNSCLNPMVYGFMSVNFRSSFRQAFWSCCFFHRRYKRNPRDAASFRSISLATSFRAEPGLMDRSTRRKIYLAPCGAVNENSATTFMEELYVAGEPKQ